MQQGGTEVAAPADAPRFPVYALDIAGVTLLSTAEVERLVEPYLGENKSFDDLEAAARAIAEAYAAKGFAETVSVTVPETQPSELVDRGILQIAVSEVPVGAVRLVDGKGRERNELRSAVPSLEEGRPLDLAALGRDLDAANRYPDRTIEPEFLPGAVPGTLDVTLNVDRRSPVHGSVEFNNDNSPQTSRPRVAATLRYTDVWNIGHSLSLTYSTAPENQDDSEVFSGSYLAPIWGTNWSVLVFGYTSNTNIASLGGTNVLGDGFQVGARGIYRLPGDRGAQSISFGVDYKDFKQDIFVGGIAADSTPIRYLPLVLEYTAADTGRFAGLRTEFDATIGATIGLRAFKRTTTVQLGNQTIEIDEFKNRAVNGIENFVHLNAGFNYTVALPRDFAVDFGWSAQLADSPLVTNEQFAAGGNESVRGYLQSEAVGDDGFVTSLELRSPSLLRGPDFRLLGDAPTPLFNEARLYGFVDAGFVSVRDAPAAVQEETRLLSAGGGLRVRMLNLITGEVTVGVPLKDGPGGAGNRDSEKGEPRVVVVVRGEF